MLFRTALDRKILLLVFKGLITVPAVSAILVPHSAVLYAFLRFHSKPAGANTRIKAKSPASP
jgi:hypothetical protein